MTFRLPFGFGLDSYNPRRVELLSLHRSYKGRRPDLPAEEVGKSPGELDYIGHTKGQEKGPKPSKPLNWIMVMLKTILSQRLRTS